MTSLIEQLGGYEKAKEFLNAKSYTIDELVMMQRYGLRPQHVEKALIEHRRQHNIYEVGDGVSHPIFSSIFTIDKVQSYSVLATTNTGYHTSLKTELIRHATDKEIVQGYRDE